jgi:hypothetical protein
MPTRGHCPALGFLPGRLRSGPGRRRPGQSSSPCGDQWLLKLVVVVSTMPESRAVCFPCDSPSMDGTIM